MIQTPFFSSLCSATSLVVYVFDMMDGWMVEEETYPLVDGLLVAEREVPGHSLHRALLVLILFS